MSANVLKIDFIDESVDITQQGNRDYIGSARVQLKDLLQLPNERRKLEGEYKILDEHSRETGRVKIRLQIHAKTEYAYDNAFAGSSRIVNSKSIEKEVVLKIVNKLAEAEFDDLNILLDMLFLRDRSNSQRVSK